MILSWCLSIQTPNLWLAGILNWWFNRLKNIRNHFCTVQQRLVKCWRQENLYWGLTQRPSSSRFMRGFLTTASAMSTVRKRGTLRIRASGATWRKYIPVTINPRRNQFWSMKMDPSSNRNLSLLKSLLKPNNKAEIKFNS